MYDASAFWIVTSLNSYRNVKNLVIVESENWFCNLIYLELGCYVYNGYTVKDKIENIWED